MTDPRDLVVAIDGGNSKTDVLLVDAAGTVLGSSHGPGVSPQNVGVAPCVEALDGLRVAKVWVSKPKRAPQPEPAAE